MWTAEVCEDQLESRYAQGRYPEPLPRDSNLRQTIAEEQYSKERTLGGITKENREASWLWEDRWWGIKIV